MNEVNRHKISYSIATQDNARNESKDTKNINNYSEKTLDTQENDFEKNNTYSIPVFIN